MEVAPPSDFFGVGPGQSLGRLLSVAARARKKRFSLWRQAYWCQNWWPIFGHTHGWLKKDQVKKNVRFTTVATTFLEPKNPCWSIVGVTIGAVSNPPGCLWFNWFVKFTPHYYPRLFHIDMNNDLFSLTIYDDVPLKQMVIFNSKPLKKGQQVSCASQCDLPNLPC